MPLLRTPAEGAIRRMCGGAAPDHHGHSSWVNVVQDALSEVTQTYTPLKLRVFVDAHSFHQWEKQGVVGDGRKGFEDV